MKRIIFCSIIVIISLTLFGCRIIGDEKSAETPQPEESYDPIPAFTADERVSLPLPETTIDYNADPLNVVSTVAGNFYVSNSYNYRDEGTINIGDFYMRDINLSFSEDGIIIEGQGYLPHIKIKKYLNEFSESEENTNQGILVRFMPIDCKNLRFLILSVETEMLCFYDGKFGRLQTNKSGGGLPLLLTKSSWDIVIENEKWYYLFLTVDDYAFKRYVLWEEGNAENISIYAGKFMTEYSLNNKVEDYLNQQMRFGIELEDGETAAISDIWVIDYEELLR